MREDAFRLAVWGDPIAHSQSPALHAAAYACLGVNWEYGRRQVGVDDFDEAISHRERSWRGLSLTMPLKERAFAWADEVDRDAELTGAVNTVLFGPQNRGFNTDVAGLAAALAAGGQSSARTARVLGGGATARSALLSLHRLGVTEADIATRRPAQAEELATFAERIGLRATVSDLGSASPRHAVDLTLSTLPGSVELPERAAVGLAAGGGALFSAAYAPWPTALVRVWGDAPVLSGLDMLLHQALLQIRIFRDGTPERELPDEGAVLAVMRAALH